MIFIVIPEPVESRGITWNHMESMESHGITWNHWNHTESLESHGITWNHVESMESRNHGISFFPLDFFKVLLHNRTLSYKLDEKNVEFSDVCIHNVKN